MEEVIKQATEWHEQHRAEHEEADEYSSCWCCCTYCELNNPYFERAEPCQRGRR